MKTQVGSRPVIIKDKCSMSQDGLYCHCIAEI